MATESVQVVGHDGATLKPIEELVPCLKCDKDMNDSEIFFKDGMLKLPQDEIEPTEIKNYCKYCVMNDQTLLDRSNYMIRYITSLLLRETNLEERLEMMETLKVENPEGFKVVADMFNVDDYVKIISKEIIEEK
jgi:hypothetical protein